MFFFKRFNAFLLCLSLPLLILLSGCETGLKKNVHPMLRDVRSISIYPFICMDCSPATEILDEKNIRSDASPVMTDYLVKRLKERTDLDVSLMPVISVEDLQAMFSGSVSYGGPVKTDAVFLGRIFYFKDRKGGNYAVSEPSRVAFDMRIIRISDGLVLFHSEFDESQKPLLSNILNIRTFLKRKGRWIDAEEMALDAMDDALEELFVKP